MLAITDTSRRYVLDPDAPFLRNMAALWAIDPDLARRVESLADDELHPTEPCKSGELTVSVISADGARRYLHSKYNPIDEAKRLIDTACVDQRFVFCIFGLGLGYHLQQLFDRVSEESILVVFEPDLKLICTALWHRDLSHIIQSKRLLILTHLDKSELFVRMTPHLALCTSGIESIVHAPSMQCQGEFHKQHQEWLVEFAAFCRTSINTLILNGRITAENIARNIGWYVAAPCLSRLRDRFKSQPAIIVSAGPSLRKNKHLLEQAKGKAVIVAVQTTLKPLLDMGVEPHFVTSLDYHDICTRFFENLPPTLKTELVAEPKASAAIFSINPGPLSILGNDFAEKLLREMNINKTALRAGATVAHLAYYLAEFIGCDPIIFVGQDLGFSDGLCYAPGTSYEDVWRPELSRFCSMEMKQWEQVVRERRILRKIPDVNGNPMYTEERLFTYLQQFERDFLRSDRQIIDASEGGARKRGTTVMTLADALDKFCAEPLNNEVPAHPGLRWDRIGQCMASLEKRRAEADQIQQISRDTLPLLEEVREFLDDQPRVNRAIARIDALRAQMNALGCTYDLIMQLTQQTELNRFQADRTIAASKATGVDRQKLQITRDISNVNGLISASGEFKKLMDEVISRLLVDREIVLAA